MNNKPFGRMEIIMEEKKKNKKNKVEGITVPDIKICFKGVIK